eukprot:9557775-Lingulodinium_polyedra.AAC.1
MPKVFKQQSTGRADNAGSKHFQPSKSEPEKTCRMRSAPRGARPPRTCSSNRGGRRRPSPGL